MFKLKIQYCYYSHYVVLRTQGEQTGDGQGPGAEGWRGGEMDEGSQKAQTSSYEINKFTTYGFKTHIRLCLKNPLEIPNPKTVKTCKNTLFPLNLHNY